MITKNKITLPTKRLIILLIPLLAAACHSEPPVVNAPGRKPDIAENLANANRYIVEAEETQINSFVERRQWSVQQTQMGVRVHEYQPGNGPKLQWDEQAAVEYSVSDLTGKELYAAMRDTLTVGRRKPTAGLDAALLCLSHGSRAHVIVPSNEAYGMVGDGARIGSRKILLYDVSIE